MRKVIVIGSGGAGKSTLARKLGEALGIKVYHLDSLYWKPGWKMTDKEEWSAVLTEIMKEDTWIMDGNYCSTMELRARAADSIIFLDYPTLRCLYGIFKRRIQFHGKSRPDMTEGCLEKLDWEFVKWVAAYRRKKTPTIIKMLKQYQSQGKEIYHLKSPRETKEFLANISKT